MGHNLESVLKLKHQHLAHHWSDVVNLDCNPKNSEYQYKHHLARLMNVYTQHKSTINNKRPDLSGKRISPMTRLYGINGIVSSQKSEEKLKRREKGWDQRTYSTEKLAEHDKKVKSKLNRSIQHQYDSNISFAHNESNNHLKSSTNFRPISHHGTSNNASETKKKRPDSRRQEYNTMSEIDLIIHGYYELDDDQCQLFDAFTTMLSQFDHADMTKILEDALVDAKKKTNLHDYGGMIDPMDQSTY